MTRWNGSHIFLAALTSVVLVCLPLAGQAAKIRAQKLLELTLSKHSELAELELSATPVGQKSCITIAATNKKEIGEKCDKDEIIALRTKQPFAEKESDGFDVTAPLHDMAGSLVGTLGIDFKPQAGQTKSDVLKQTTALLKELEPKIQSKAFLFQSAAQD